MAIKINRESNEQTAIRECRRVFLTTAAQHPEIRLEESLRQQVFNPVQKYWIDSRLNDLEFHRTEDGEHALEHHRNERERLMEQWSVENNLAFDWVIEATRDQLSAWPAFPDLPAFSAIPGYKAEFNIESWYPNETEGAYRNRVLAKFRGALDAHIRELKRLRSGLLLKHRGSQGTHYHWAAEYVCLRWNFARIAMRSGGVAPQAVRQAVVPILERIGIPAWHKPKNPKRNGF